MNFQRRLSSLSGLPRPRSRTLLLGMAAMALSGATTAQVAGYNFTRVPGTYTEITGGTLLGGEAEPYSSVYASGSGTATSSSNYYFQVQGAGFPIGFSFPYNGGTFDRLGVSGAGYVSLGQSVNGATAVIVSAHTSDFYGPLSHPYTAGQASVIPPPDRLNRIVGLAPTSGLQGAGAGTGASIRIETIGSAPNRVCVIQWKNYRRVDFNGSTAERLNFQIRLNENGVVELQFKDPTAGWQGGLTTTQMGLRGAGATVAPTDFQTMVTTYDGGLGFFDWANVTVGANINGRVQLGGTAGNKPADGEIFRWTAPTCPAPANVKLVTAGAHSLTISYNYSGGPETYDWAVNTANSPTTGTPITGSGATGGTLTATGLASNTQYYAFIRKNCGGGDLSAWVQVTSISTTIPANTMVPNAIVTAADCGESWNKSFEFVGGAGPIDGTWSICAPNAGQLAKVTFSAYSVTGNNSAVYVHNGPNTSSPLISSGQPALGAPSNVAGGYYGSSIIGPFTSTPGGCLTFHYSTQYGGDSWNAAVTCPPAPTCFAPTNINVTPSAQGGSVAFTGTSAQHQYKVVSNGSPNTAPAIVGGISAANPIVITDNALVGGTAYTLYMRGICTPGDTSDWSIVNNFTTLAGCGGPFMNAGYLTANQYPQNQDVTTTICPNTPGDVVTVAFTAFSMGLAGSNTDALYVFDGPTSSATQLASSNGVTTAGFPAGGYSGNAIPGPFTSTHSSGCLTFRFRTDNQNSFAFAEKGFNSNVTCAPAPACATPSAVSVSSITGTGVSVSWTGGGSNYIIEYGAPGFTAGTGATAGSGSSTVITNASSPWPIGGLSATTAYKVVVRKACAGPSYSSNSFPVNFSTSMDCSTAQVVTCGQLATAAFVSGNVGSSVYQSTSYNNAACAQTVGGDGVELLYRITAPTNGTYQLNIATNTFGQFQQAAYLMAPVSAGCGSAAFTCIGSGLSSYAPDYPNAGIPSTINTTLTAGDYYVLVDASSGTNGNQQFQVYCPGIPPCINAPTYPGNNSSVANTATAITFSWPAAFGATAYDVYINNVLVSTNQAGTTYVGGTAASYGSGSTVNWRVVPRNADGTATCPTNWSFRVGGNGSANAIPLTSGVAVGATNRTANGYTNAQTNGGFSGRDATFSFTASPCANGVDVNFCLNAFITQNYYRTYVMRASDNMVVASNEGGVTVGQCRVLNVAAASIEPGQNYYVIVDTYSGEVDFTISYTEIVNTADTDGDGTPDCQDACPENPDLIVEGQCGCEAEVDTDSDGIADCVDECPLLAGQIGSACDAGPFFTGGIITDECECVGIPVSTHNWNLTLVTDANGNETTWEIRQQLTNALVASGGPYPNNTTVNVVVNMPDVGAWTLRVLDSGNNGITGGGYALRDQNGNRVIDNLGNGGGFTSVSESPEGFFSPVGTDALRAVDCDNVERRSNEMIVCDPNAAVSAQWQVGNQYDDGYEFWFFDPNGGYSRHVFRNHATSGGYSPANAQRACKLGLLFASNPLPQGTLLNVRVRGRVNGTDLAWGPTCRLKVDETAANCHTTQLENVNAATMSCGVTGLKTNGSSRIWAKPVTRYIQASNTYVNANRYKFHFVNVGENTTFDIVLSSYPMLIYPQYGFQLGATYTVTVQASFDGGSTYCPYGAACQISFAATNHRDGDAIEEMPALSNELQLWPNPNRGDELFLSMAGLQSSTGEVTIDVVNMFGEKVLGRTIAIGDGGLNITMKLDAQLASGLYLVNLTADGKTITKRLVIQH